MNRKIASAVATALFMIPTVEAGNIAAMTCATCNNLTDLRGTAQNWINTQATYVPATIVVTSLNTPITGIFHTHLACAKRCVIQLSNDASTTTNMQAAYVDGLMYTRASKELGHPIATDLTNAGGSLESSVSLEIERAITYTNDSGTENWHLITFLIGDSPSVTYFKYFDPVYNAVFQIFIGDIITVTYPGGWSEKFQFQGADVTPSHRWTRVPGTLMYFGKPYNPPPGTGTPIPAESGIANAPNTWSGGSIRAVLGPNCYASGTLTVTAPDGSSVSGTGFSPFPC